jgi:hypothetical protein
MTKDSSEQQETLTPRVQAIVSAPSVVSFGGGINSTALLFGLHERGEKPDAILFADTGGEKPPTYEHVVKMQEWCQQAGFPEITIVRNKTTLEEANLQNETIPSKAFGFGTCSERFKIDPQRKWIKAQGWTHVTFLVGIHAGETRRATRLMTDGGQAIRYPLIEWGWGQSECEAAIDRNGMAKPCKSACFFCPSMKKREVLALSKEFPDLFERAVEMESAALAAGNLQTVKGLGRNWSWSALVAADERQMKLFTDDQAPLCDVCVDW